MVNPINPKPKRNDTRSVWFSYAIFSGATMQWAVNMVVFGYLGSLLAKHFHQEWWTFAGVILGVFTGGSTFFILIKRLMGEK